MYLTTTDRLELDSECSTLDGVSFHVGSMSQNKTNVPRPQLRKHRKYNSHTGCVLKFTRHIIVIIIGVLWTQDKIIYYYMGWKNSRLKKVFRFLDFLKDFF